MKVEKTVVAKEVVTKVEVPEYVLTLTEKEAEMLLLVVGYVQMGTQSSPYYINGVYQRLTALGVKSLYNTSGKFRGLSELRIPTPTGEEK